MTKSITKPLMAFWVGIIVALLVINIFVDLFSTLFFDMRVDEVEQKVNKISDVLNLSDIEIISE